MASSCQKFSRISRESVSETIDMSVCILFCAKHEARFLRWTKPTFKSHCEYERKRVKWDPHKEVII